MAEKNLVTRLLLPGIDEYELLWVIEDHYRSARSTPEDEIIYPNAAAVRSQDSLRRWQGREHRTRASVRRIRP